MGHRLVGTHQEVAPVGQRRKTRRAAGQHGKAVALELQLADDFRAKEAVDVAGGGNFKAGPQCLGDDATADEFAAFEDEDSAPGAGQVGGGHQAVVAGPDDDGIVFRIHEVCSPGFSRPLPPKGGTTSGALETIQAPGSARSAAGRDGPRSPSARRYSRSHAAGLFLAEPRAAVAADVVDTTHVPLSIAQDDQAFPHHFGHKIIAWRCDLTLMPNAEPLRGKMRACSRAKISGDMK